MKKRMLPMHVAKKRREKGLAILADLLKTYLSKKLDTEVESYQTTWAGQKSPQFGCGLRDENCGYKKLCNIWYDDWNGTIEILPLLKRLKPETKRELVLLFSQTFNFRIKVPRKQSF